MTIINNKNSGIGEIRESQSGESCTYTFSLNETHPLYCYLKGEIALTLKKRITSITELNRLLLLAVVG